MVGDITEGGSQYDLLNYCNFEEYSKCILLVPDIPIKRIICISLYPDVPIGRITCINLYPDVPIGRIT